VPAASFATTRPAAVPRSGAAPPAPGQQAAHQSRGTRAPLHDAYGRGGAMVPADTGEADLLAPTPEEFARWEAPAVREFRGRLGKYAIVNAVIIVFALITDVDLMAITAFWTLFLAFKYAKLWSDGYDWRDVFKQPRDRLFFDVVAEKADEASAMFDPEKRARLRERVRRQRLRGEARERMLPGLPGPASPAVASAALSGAFGDAVRQAMADRDEVLRLVNTMPKAQREQLPDVVGSATALADKIQGLAATVAELDRNSAPGAGEVVEEEIARLEAAANPLERVASEERVKRLAYLKRQRRALVEMSRRRDAAASKLESCRLALQNMRLDLVRLRTGAGSSVGQVTTVAERAMALAREVDAMVYAQDEVAGLAGRGPRGAGRGASQL
jgi:serine/threonine-protein kinase